MKGSNHRLVVSVFLLLFSASLLSYYAAAAVDILATNQSLPDGQTIISSNGTFEMGFFNLENGRYFGIWFKKVTKFTLVWIANRDSPLLFNDTSGFLHMSPQGLLILQNATTNNNNNNLIWSSNSSSSSSLSNNPIAQLLDSGNLVIRDSNDLASSNPIWQSFDHPGNTMLPGLKLGLNLVSGIDRFLQSWKNPNDPSRGQYIFRMDPNGFPQEYLLNGTTKIFRSGPWNGLRFSGSPGLKPNQVYTYEFVNTPEEIYYKFDLIQPSVYSILLLNSNGVLQRLTWNNRTEDWTVYLNAPADNCDYYGLCSAYGFCSISNSPVCNCLDKFVPKYPTDWLATDWSRGCVRRTPLDCKNGDGFVKYEGIKLPDTRNSWYDNGMSLKECERICLNNCSCMAYTNTDIRGKGSGCLLWFDDLMDITKFTSNGQDIYIRMASSELGSKAGKGKVIGISIGVVFGVLLLGMFLTLYIWKMKKKNKRQTEELITQGKSGSYSDKQQQQLHQTNEDEIMEDLDLELPLVDFSKIVEATNNFSKANKLGEGGFGPVYEGKFMDGQEIAVKRLSEYSIQGLDEFKNEVKCIAKLQHRNLVKLLGYCLHGEEKMLIYEFMPNKSLDYFIFDNDRRRLVDWTMRYEIITGIARGLLYLHQDSRFRIIHRDLKASNILLDHDMKPKISDFGMARIFGGTETAANTRRVVGTYGYMSPEYAVDGFFSTKSDIFSYGVLVLEIVSGKKNRGFFHSDHHHNLLGHAWLLFKDGRFHELIDEELSKSCHFSQVIRSINVALLCVQQNPDDRPSMSSVILMLASEGPLPIPKEPGFFTERNLFFEPSARDKSSSSKQADSSGNDFSITLLDAR